MKRRGRIGRVLWTCRGLLPLCVLAAALAGATPAAAQPRLGDASDRAAFRAWFVLLADAQFERPAPEVTDCAALIRFAFREALRDHTSAWARRVALPFTPAFQSRRATDESLTVQTCVVPPSARMMRANRRTGSGRPL